MSNVCHSFYFDFYFIICKFIRLKKVFFYVFVTVLSTMNVYSSTRRWLVDLNMEEGNFGVTHSYFYVILE